MKITHSTADKLIISHTPWVMAILLACLVLLFVAIGLLPLGQSDEPVLWVFSFMFIVVGGGLWLMALELFARRLQFVFERSSDRITIRRLSIFNRAEITHKLSRLIECRIERDTTSDGQATQRPVLILRSTRDGKSAETRVPLYAYFTSGSGPETVCDAINRWWASPDAAP